MSEDVRYTYLVGQPSFDSLVKFVVCPEQHGTHVHRDATRFYCVGCGIVHLITP